MIYLHLAEGFEEIEAVTVADILRRAKIEVKTVSIGKDSYVKGTHGMTIEADMVYDDVDYENCEMIILPGGMPGAANLQEHEGLRKHLECFAENGKKIAAICAAPMILGKYGIIEGKTATIYPGMEDKLTGARHEDKNVVVDGNIITGRGPAAAMEFALAIVKELKNEAAAADVAGDLLYNLK